MKITKQDLVNIIKEVDYDSDEYKDYVRMVTMPQRRKPSKKKRVRTSNTPQTREEYDLAVKTLRDQWYGGHSGEAESGDELQFRPPEEGEESEAPKTIIQTAAEGKQMKLTKRDLVNIIKEQIDEDDPYKEFRDRTYPEYKGDARVHDFAKTTTRAGFEPYPFEDASEGVLSGLWRELNPFSPHPYGSVARVNPSSIGLQGPMDSEGTIFKHTEMPWDHYSDAPQQRSAHMGGLNDEGYPLRKRIDRNVLDPDETAAGVKTSDFHKLPREDARHVGYSVRRPGDRAEDYIVGAEKYPADWVNYDEWLRGDPPPENTKEREHWDRTHKVREEDIELAKRGLRALRGRSAADPGGKPENFLGLGGRKAYRDLQPTALQSAGSTTASRRYDAPRDTPGAGQGIYERPEYDQTGEIFGYAKISPAAAEDARRRWPDKPTASITYAPSPEATGRYQEPLRVPALSKKQGTIKEMKQMKITKQELTQLIKEELDSQDVHDLIGGVEQAFLPSEELLAKIANGIEDLDISMDFLASVMTGEDARIMGAYQAAMGRGAARGASQVPGPVAPTED